MIHGEESEEDGARQWLSSAVTLTCSLPMVQVGHRIQVPMVEHQRCPFFHPVTLGS